MLCWEGFLDTLVLLNREARVISAEVRLGSGEESRPLEDPERETIITGKRRANQCNSTSSLTHAHGERFLRNILSVSDKQLGDGLGMRLPCTLQTALEQS